MKIIGKMIKVRHCILIIILVATVITATIVTKRQSELKPELMINALTFYPFKPATGSIETIKFQLQNTGNAPAKNFEVCLEDNGNIVNREFVKILSPGKKTTINFNYEFTSPGEHTLTVRVDCTNTLKGLNKHNDIIKMHFEVAENPEKSLVYKTRLGNAWFSTNYGGSSPVIFKNKIYIGGKNQYFFCINKDTGKIIWKFKVKNAGIYPGIYTTPVFYGKNVYFGTTGSNAMESLGHVYALDADSGKERWEFETDADVSLIKIFKKELLAVDRNGNIYCIDAYKGNLLQKFKTNEMNDILCASMAIENNTIYIKTECFDFIYLTALEGNTKREIWSIKIKKNSSDMPGSVIALNGLLYLNGKYCIDSKTGKIIWINKASCGLAALDKDLFVLTKDGELYKVDLTNGSIIWKEAIEQATAPLYAKNNILVIGTISGNVYLISEDYGKIIERFKTNSAITIKPLLYGNRLYVVSEDGYLYCFKK